MFVFCFKQKTSYELSIRDWSSDVCSSYLWVSRLRSTRTATGGVCPFDMQLWLAVRDETSPDGGMTEAVATGATADSPPSSARLDDRDPPWPLRPWLMAAICSVAGLAFHLLIDSHYEHEIGNALCRESGCTSVYISDISR